MAHSMMVIMVLQVLVLGVTSRSDGAPEEACKLMRPYHHVDHNSTEPLVDPMSGVPYYKLVPSKTEGIKPNELIEVQIVTTDETKYMEGFFVQARDKDEVVSDANPIRYGTWIKTEGTVLRCDDQGVTHYNPRINGTHIKWENVTLTWKAPPKEFKNVVFQATVVKGYSSFFMHIKSDVLNNGASFVLPTLLLIAITSLLALF